METVKVSVCGYVCVVLGMYPNNTYEAILKI